MREFTTNTKFEDTYIKEMEQQLQGKQGANKGLTHKRPNYNDYDTTT